MSVVDACNREPPSWLGLNSSNIELAVELNAEPVSEKTDRCDDAVEEVAEGS